MKVIVTGSHGLIGTELVRVLKVGGHEVTRLVRTTPDAGELHWDPTAGTIDRAGLEGHDAVVHLAGAGIGDKRWDDDRKAEIRDSRVVGTRLLAEALASLAHPPQVLASGSAIGFYGNRGDEELTESSPPGTGFLADVVKAWEDAAAPAEAAGIRVVRLRTGIVLSHQGGALKPMLAPFKLGLGGRISSGQQWWSWISLDDEVGAIGHILNDDSIRGPVNLTAPHPVSNADFAKALGRALNRPAVVPVPDFAIKLKMGAEMADEMVLASQKIIPSVLVSTGYHFSHPTIDQALKAALNAEP